ncbi:glycerate kinase-like [Styela clava]
MRMPAEASQRIFKSAIGAVLPPALVHSNLERLGDTLAVGSKTYDLRHNVHIVGFGKAVSGMCRAVQQLLGDHLVRGIISVPSGTSKILEEAGKSFLLPDKDGKISMCEGAVNNLPDESCICATQRIIAMLRDLTKDDIVITLVSGGGSALLCAPIPPLTLDDKMRVTSFLAKQGATIQELNIIRRSLSIVKGGGLAQIAYPSKMVALILSDIIGDPLDLIASGPTVCTESNVEQTRIIMKKYGLHNNISADAKTILLNPVQNKPGDLQHVQNILVGSNTVAVNASLKEAETLGYMAFVLSSSVEGEARDVGVFLIEFMIKVIECITKRHLETEEEFTKFLYEHLIRKYESKNWPWISNINRFARKLHQSITSSNPILHKICIIAAGETTVTVNGTGKGGRNQEMVLAAAIHLFKYYKNIDYNLCFLSGGTDGQDGPTDSAGAFVDSSSNFITDPSDLAQAEKALLNNNSYHFLSNYSDTLLKTGLTGTNVMDLQILTIQRF